MKDIYDIGINLLATALLVVCDILMAMAAIALFDGIIGTDLYNPQTIGIVALVFFAIGMLKK